MSAETALLYVRQLHGRRSHQPGDFITFGQTEFPDLCAHCSVPYPCATAAMIERHA